MREETKEIYLTAEEYFRLDIERLPFGDFEEPTPIMDKVRRAGIEPLSFTMMIRIDKLGEGVYLSDTVGVLTLRERIHRRIVKTSKRIISKLNYLLRK